MSQISYKKITAEELIKFSSSIIVVKQKEPFITKKNIAIGDGYPDFILNIMNYEIVKILKTEADLKAGQSILVYPANYETQLKIHKEYHIKKISRSPVYFIYKSFDENYNYINSNNYIIFLKMNDSNFELSAVNAFEDIKYKNKIAGLIKK